MEALIWWGEHDVRQVEVDEPRAEPGDVIVRVIAAGICGSDVGRYVGGGSRQPPPIILGHEFVGEVTSRPEDGSGLALGDVVAVRTLLGDRTCSLCRRGSEHLCRNRTLIGAHRPGGFAEFVAVPATHCHPLHLDRHPEVGALVEPLACAIHAVARAQIKAGDRMLVLGAGALGLLVGMIASGVGPSQLVISDPSSGRRETGEHLGIGRLIDPSALDARILADDVSDDGLFDVVVDAFGSAATRQQAIQMTRPGGHVVLLGLHDGVLDVSASGLVLNEISLIGSFAYQRAEFIAATDRASEGTLDGFLDACDIRPMRDGAAAFAALAEGSIVAPRVLLRP